MKKLFLALIVFGCFAPLCHADITSNLVGWWKLDEGSGSTAADSSGTGNTGTLQNSPSWITGKVGPFALLFNSASSQYVSLGSAPISTYTSPNSVCFWINETDNTDVTTFNQTPINFFQDSSNYVRILEDNGPPAGDVYISFVAGGVNYSTETTGQPLQNNQWVNFCYTFDGSTLLSYVNGVNVSVGNMGLLSNGGVNYIGSRGTSGGYTDGSMDDIRVYTRALSPADVLEVYNYPSVSVRFHRFVGYVGYQFRFFVGNTFR